MTKSSVLLQAVQRAQLVAALAAGCIVAGSMPLVAEQAGAQTAPSAQEVAGYGGLHAAAYRGDAAELRRQLAAGAAADTRDSHGRTPLHVASFRGHHEAIRVLAKGRRWTTSTTCTGPRSSKAWSWAMADRAIRRR